jgi:hypothetical protein
VLGIGTGVVVGAYVEGALVVLVVYSGGLLVLFTV